MINAPQDGTSNEVAVSFEVHWAPGIKHFKVRDEASGMAGEFIRNTATMAWSAESAGQSFVSGLEESSSSLSAQVGHERNGVFFPH